LCNYTVWSYSIKCFVEIVARAFLTHIPSPDDARFAVAAKALAAGNLPAYAGKTKPHGADRLAVAAPSGPAMPLIEMA
jgi:hypothetical protein